MARASCYVALLLLSVSFTKADYGIKNIGWWKNTPFYQIYPRSFMDSNGDGIGDLKGITNKLDHFVEAGIGAVWLSPFYASPMIDFGYDISDFKEIHEDYGTMEDFEVLTKTAKQKNLKVIVDLVPNHSSDEHEWFIESEKGNATYKDYYIWKAGNETTPPNNWISVFSGPAWTYSPIRKEWYFHQFHKKQPDLNYNNPDVRQAMEDVIVFWMDKGVDGFRVDAVPHLFEADHLRDEPRSNDGSSNNTDYTYLLHPYTKDQPKTYELVKSWRRLIDSYTAEEGTDERVMMTEAYTTLEKTVEYYDNGAHVPFNFKFITDISSSSPPSAYKKLIDTWETEAKEKKGVSNWVMGNHDRSRTETRYKQRGDQMTMLAMILPGVSVTYYGEEIGMEDKDDITWEETQDPQGCNAGKDKYKQRSRDPCRTPFQWDNTTSAGFSNNQTTWLKVNENYLYLNLKEQRNLPISHFSLFKNLTSLKKNSQAVINGTLQTVVKNDDKVLAIIRTHNVGSEANHSVILVINFSDNDTMTVDLTSEVPSNLALTGDVAVSTIQSPLHAGTNVDLTNLSLAGKSSAVIQVRNKRETSKNSAVDNASISFTKTAIMIVATLVVTFR